MVASDQNTDNDGLTKSIARLPLGRWIGGSVPRSVNVNVTTSLAGRPSHAIVTTFDRISAAVTKRRLDHHLPLATVRHEDDESTGDGA
jgi:hypothetical protein